MMDGNAKAQQIIDERTRTIGGNRRSFVIPADVAITAPARQSDGAVRRCCCRLEVHCRCRGRSVSPTALPEETEGSPSISRCPRTSVRRYCLHELKAGRPQPLPRPHSTATNCLHPPSGCLAGAAVPPDRTPTRMHFFCYACIV